MHMKQLKQYLKDKSKGEFAKKVGISGPYLSQILSGVRTPSGSVAFKIQTATNNEVSASSFFEGAA